MARSVFVYLKRINNLLSVLSVNILSALLPATGPTLSRLHFGVHKEADDMAASSVLCERN